jgi:hypothetical protein
MYCNPLAAVIGGRYDGSPGPRDARHLLQGYEGGVQPGEHAEGDNEIERLIVEAKGMHITQTCIDRIA